MSTYYNQETGQYENFENTVMALLDGIAARISTESQTEEEVEETEGEPAPDPEVSPGYMPPLEGGGN